MQTLSLKLHQNIVNIVHTCNHESHANMYKYYKAVGVI